MNILILGSGGRECALAWKISQSLLCENLYIAPGNGGTRQYGKNVTLSLSDFNEIAQFSIEKKIELIVVGPEDPLVMGIVNFFKRDSAYSNIKIIGPDKFAAQLEGSKSFAKTFMQKYGIPTAAYMSFQSHEVEQAKTFLHSLNPPYVIKADGLAAGKGVVICGSLEEAKQTIKHILVDGVFGSAGNSLVIEEFLDGIEMSVFVMTDGKEFVLLPEAKDYKRIGDNDTGLNTGGMGTVSPVPFADELFMKKVRDQVLIPTVNGIAAEGMNYVGFVFFGLMNVKGNPYVIEYNVRLGDPETQSILPRIEEDIVQMMLAAAEGKLSTRKATISSKTVVNVVLASGGYPGDYEKGISVELPDELNDGIVFHAGTIYDEQQQTLKTSGGRVLSACGMANDIESALHKAYEIAEVVRYKNKYFRRDIGKDLMLYSSKKH